MTSPHYAQMPKGSHVKINTVIETVVATVAVNVVVTVVVNVVNTVVVNGVDSVCLHMRVEVGCILAVLDVCRASFTRDPDVLITPPLVHTTSQSKQENRKRPPHTSSYIPGGSPGEPLQRNPRSCMEVRC